MATASNALSTLLNEHDVARITGLSLATVRRWRLLRQGPKFLKIGAACRYRVSDLEEWLASRPAGGSVTQPDQASTRRASEATAATSRRRGKR